MLFLPEDLMKCDPWKWNRGKDTGGAGRSANMDMSSYSLLQRNPKVAKVAYDEQEDSIFTGCTSSSWEQCYDGAGCENTECFTESNYAPGMNQQLWSQLPEDLVDRILACLPVVSFLQLRIVCKKWSTIMYSPSFLEMCSQVPIQGPFFIKIHRSEYNRMLPSYNPVLGKWHEIPINFLPSHAGIPVASAGGLLCFINRYHGYVDNFCTLFVCNPLTKSWRELPSMPCKQRPILVSMVTERHPFRYKVIVVSPVTTDIFDSVTGAWRRVGSLPRGEEISRNVAFSNGNLYCLTPRWYNCALLAYNLEQEVWEKVKTGRLPGYCQFRNLVGCKGCIVIVGKSVRQHVLSVCIWLLDPKTLKWKEIGRMPQPMSDHFLGRPSESFYCTGHGDLIFLTRDNSEMGLLFNLSQKAWVWVYDCPSLDSFAFEPRLDAVA
ncbi:hypothetical protein R1sor_004754 [Riccia sorocarpa]|uniref:F-box domain-containing protein n=1 Tax=Riccia sorocarpa TaxID=122646 RepID=A0ABD3HI55_9MARC